MKKLIIIMMCLAGCLGMSAQLVQRFGVGIEIEGPKHKQFLRHMSESAYFSYRLDYGRLQVKTIAGLEFTQSDNNPVYGGIYKHNYSNPLSIKLGADVGVHLFEAVSAFTGLSGNVILYEIANPSYHYDEAGDGWVHWRLGLGLTFKRFYIQAGWQKQLFAGHTHWFTDDEDLKWFGRVTYYFKTF